jgi:hypothetical protein
MVQIIKDCQQVLLNKAITKLQSDCTTLDIAGTRSRRSQILVKAHSGVFSNPGKKVAFPGSFIAVFKIVGEAEISQKRLFSCSTARTRQGIS